MKVQDTVDRDNAVKELMQENPKPQVQIMNEDEIYKKQIEEIDLQFQDLIHSELDGEASMIDQDQD